LLTSGFDPAFLADHFRRHGGEFDAETPEDYEALADVFLGGSLGTETLECEKASNGDIVRYNYISQEFGVLSQHRIIRTYFKPSPRKHKFRTNLAYYQAECRK